MRSNFATIKTCLLRKAFLAFNEIDWNWLFLHWIFDGGITFIIFKIFGRHCLMHLMWFGPILNRWFHSEAILKFGGIKCNRCDNFRVLWWESIVLFLNIIGFHKNSGSLLFFSKRVKRSQSHLCSIALRFTCSDVVTCITDCYFPLLLYSKYHRWPKL